MLRVVANNIETLDVRLSVDLKQAINRIQRVTIAQKHTRVLFSQTENQYTWALHTEGKSALSEVISGLDEDISQ